MSSATRSDEDQTPGVGGSACLRRFGYFIYSAYLAMKWSLIEFFTKHKKLDIENLPKRTGEVAVVTGGNRGIGLQIVKKLLQLDYHVILGVRNTEFGNVAVNKIRQTGILTGLAECLELDLASLSSVRRFANAVLVKHPRLHLLVNNAATAFVPYNITPDGFETHFQVNYLSHFLLTNLLLPKLIDTAATQEKVCRVVNTSTVGQHGGEINFDDLQSTKFYSPYKALYDSKLAQVTASNYLDKRLRSEDARVHVYCVHPGIIPTDLMLNLGCFVNAMIFWVKPLLRNTDQAADSVLYAALSPDIENQGGIFLCNSKKMRSSPKSEEVSNQQKLWSLSIKMTNTDQQPS